MKYSKLLFLLAILSMLLLVAACTAGSSKAEASNIASTANEPADEDMHNTEENHEDGDDHAEDDHGDSMDHMHVEAPHDFAELENPFAGDHEAVEAGAETFSTLCVTCHGEEGKGDGPGAVELDPKPADLSDGVMMGDLSDGYLFWRVTKGGATDPFNSAMPAWEEGLTEEQRWQVITYIRTLSAPQDHMEEMEDEHAAGDEHDD